MRDPVCQRFFGKTVASEERRVHTLKEFIHQELKDVLNHSIQDTTNRFAGIQLVEQNAELSDDICTVHTMLEGNHRAALLLCADTALLTRLAQNILHSPKVTLQDVEDVAKEYLNIICGQVVAGLFQIARVTSRFQIPSFRTGLYLPEEEVPYQCVLNYDSGSHGRAHLICMGPFISDQSQSA